MWGRGGFRPVDVVGYLDRVRLCDNRYCGRSPRFCGLAEEWRSEALAGLSVYTGREMGMTALSRYAKRPKRLHPYRFWLLTGDR